MPLATTVMHYLQRNGVPWQQLLHDRVGNLAAALAVAGLKSSEVAEAELFIDAKGVLMSVVPFGLRTDIELVNLQLKRRVWTPPHLQALCLMLPRVDCLRVSGLIYDAVFGIGP
jgi:hypothetical protein